MVGYFSCKKFKKLLMKSEKFPPCQFYYSYFDILWLLRVAGFRNSSKSAGFSPNSLAASYSWLCFFLGCADISLEIISSTLLKMTDLISCIAWESSSFYLLSCFTLLSSIVLLYFKRWYYLALSSCLFSLPFYCLFFILLHYFYFI